MPLKTKCYVKDCKNYVVFRFPQAKRPVWLAIIGRPDDNPKSNNGLCSDHFCDDDFVRESSRGVILTRKRLRPNAVPSLNIPEQTTQVRLLKNGFEEHRVNATVVKSEDDIGVPALPMHEDPQIPMDEDPQIPLDEDTKIRSDEGTQIPLDEDTPNPLDEDTQSPLDEDTQIPLDEDPQVVLNCLEIVMNEPASCVSSEVSSVDDIQVDEVNVSEINCANEVEFVSECDNGTHDNIALVGESRKVDADPLQIYTPKVVSVSPRVQVAQKKITKKRTAKYDIHDYESDPNTVKYFTGLESYEKFIFVFQSLSTDLVKIKYRDFEVKCLSLENQFFLTLWKLRKNTPDFELGLHFGVSHTTIANIFVSFVLFMTEQWSKLDNWPSRSLTDFYMPDSLKKHCPNTGLIIDSTEIPISKPSNPRYQQATLSTYKNKNTVKLKGGATLLEDRKSASEKVRIERLISFTKTYNILSEEMDRHFIPIVSEIFYVCVMLCNFREGNISR